MARLHGIGVSPGIVAGPVMVFGRRTLEAPKYAIKDPDTELRRLDDAISSARADLVSLRTHTAEHLGEQHADIFEAHLMVLEDVTLREEVEQGVRESLLNVEYITDGLIRKYARLVESVDDSRFRERAQDLMDVGNRILGKLLGAELESLERLPKPSIIVARDLAPSAAANLDLANTLGVITDLGGPTSHTAILARALEIPAVVGLMTETHRIAPGDIVILDGGTGEVIIHPDEATLIQFMHRREEQSEERLSLIVGEAERRSETIDGFAIPTEANIELPVEVAHAKGANAMGIGLYRTEYLFLNKRLPDEEEQYQAYSQAAEAFAPHPVTLRTLDLGGDKFASHLDLPEDLNPQLGWRAIRFCLARPDIFKEQLRAMLRASMHGDVRIMFPLISSLDEYLRVMDIVHEVSAELVRRGIPFKNDIKFGSMIEVPSAVITADDLARNCDFFSIGTNDLIQYSLAVDRVNEKIAHMYEPANPAVIRMLRFTVRAARRAGISCSVCGEMAGDPLFTELLVGLGVDSLSMSPVSLPLVRAELAAISMREAREFAYRALKMTSVKQIRGEMVKRFKNRKTMRRRLCHLDSAPGPGPKGLGPGT